MIQYEQVMSILNFLIKGPVVNSETHPLACGHFNLKG